MVLAVGTHCGQSGVRALGFGQAQGAPGNHHAGSQSLEVPLPGRGQGLIKVIDVEDNVALGGGEAAEFSRWASPQAYTRSPETGVVARSAAMRPAEPR